MKRKVLPSKKLSRLKEDFQDPTNFVLQGQRCIALHRPSKSYKTKKSQYSAKRGGVDDARTDMGIYLLLCHCEMKVECTGQRIYSVPYCEGISELQKRQLLR